MKKSLFLMLSFLTAMAQAAPLLVCHDTDTFTPLKLTVDDDDTNGPVIKLEGLYTAGILHQLGLHTATAPFEAKDLVLTLPGQPRKSIRQDDHRVRHYTQFGITGPSKAQFRLKNQWTEKEVQFGELEIFKLVSADRNTSYSVTLHLSHSGKNWSYTKHYYEHSCR